MFTPRKSPLKEGRSHPGLPYAGSLVTGRGRFSPRQIGLVLLIVICVPVFYYIHTSGEGISVAGGANTRTKTATDVDLGDKVKSTISPEALDSIPKADSLSESRPEYKSVDNEEGSQQRPSKSKIVEVTSEKQPVDEDDDDIPRKPASKAPLEPSGSEVWSERPQFERALERIINMLPDEVHMRELVREVDSTGKERIREMGLRTKQYKKYLEAWEALHLTEDEEGGMYVRDDVLQYLRSHVHTNGGEHDGSGSTLAEMSLAQTMRSYEAYRSFMNKFSQLLFPWTMPYFSDHMSLHAHIKKGGRGIVLTAGDNQAPFILTTVVTFRKLGCNLPIEVMYLGDQDLGEDYRSELEAMDGVVTRDIAQMVNDEGWRLAGWAAKPFAILLSSFREVIFIDADSLFFRNPEVLFEDPGYQKTGALFFRDRKIMPESKKRFLQQILSKPIPKAAKESRYWTGESGHMQESGVVVVDKWQHFVPLLLTTRMNGPDRDGNKEKGKIGVYDLMYGDKETFWISWLLVGDEKFHWHQGDAGIMGVLKDPEESKKDVTKSDLDPEQQAALLESLEHQIESSHPDNYTICAPQLLHLDVDGKPLWFNGWILDNKFAARGQKKFATFSHYLIEPRDVRDPGAWQLSEGNVCCLTTDNDKMFEFAQKDQDVLSMIMERAHEIGAYGNQ